MKLLEYEAKQLLEKYDIPTPGGDVVLYGGELPRMPRVIKSQVPVGGRGKLGGIRIVETPEEAEAAVDEVFALDIKGYRPKVLLAEKQLDIERELYLSLLINREAATVDIMAHSEGGVEVESRDSDSFLRVSVADGNWNAIGEQLAEYYNLYEQTFALQDMIKDLYKAFVEQDMTLLEINPLALTSQDKLVAADCKIELDDMAAFRHPDWTFEDTVADANFVTLDNHGTVATIANGAGLAMATVDAVMAAGLRPANFLDIGGAATGESIAASFARICQFESVDTIIINMFGGIVRCDVVATAIVEAKSSLPPDMKLAARLSGNRSQEAKEILEAVGITYHESLENILKELKS